MLLQIWRFVTLMLAACTLGMAFCHLLEMPVKMRYDARMWLAVQQSLYRMFGAQGPGAWLEVGSILTAVVLTVLVRSRPGFGWTLAGALCLVAAHVIWWIFIAPANAQTAAWTPATIPTNWEHLRAQWEYTHAARAFLMLAGLALLHRRLSRWATVASGYAKERGCGFCTLRWETKRSWAKPTRCSTSLRRPSRCEPFWRTRGTTC
jgi:hypothetical protein